MAQHWLHLTTLRGTPTGRGGHLHLVLMLGQLCCWKIRSAACSPGHTRQPGTTQGLVQPASIRWPQCNKEWTAPSPPVCLPAILGHVGSPWRLGPVRGVSPHFSAKTEAVWVMRRYPCKWNSFWVTSSTHTHTHNIVFYRRDNSLLEEPFRISQSTKKNNRGQHSRGQQVKCRDGIILFLIYQGINKVIIINKSIHRSIYVFLNLY